jgi:hypothetical protein
VQLLIRKELNEFKTTEMQIHEESKHLLRLHEYVHCCDVICCYTRQFVLDGVGMDLWTSGSSMPLVGVFVWRNTARVCFGFMGHTKYVPVTCSHVICDAI